MSQKILVVDDDPCTAEMLQAILRDVGYDVMIVENASGALVVFADGAEFDLVLLDARLPGLSGPVLRRTLRQMRPTLRLAYVTGMGEHPEGDNSRVPVLFKPFQIAKLIAFVREHISP